MTAPRRNRRRLLFDQRLHHLLDRRDLGQQLLLREAERRNFLQNLLIPFRMLLVRQQAVSELTLPGVGLGEAEVHLFRCAEHGEAAQRKVEIHRDKLEFTPVETAVLQKIQ